MDYKKLVDDFGAAFNRHDANALSSMMTEDCTFYTLAGAEKYGNVLNGNANIKKAFEGVWAAMPDAHWNALDSFVSGNKGLSLWCFSGTNADGTRIEADGCDIFTFKDGKIHVKNAFRKNRPLV